MLSVGAIIYVLFREPVIFSESLTQHGIHLPVIPLKPGFWSNIIRFILPDALWAWALLSYSSTIKITFIRIISLLLAPLYEIGQLLGLIRGTFDYIDLIIYIIITLIFIRKWTRKEKNLSQLDNA